MTHRNQRSFSRAVCGTTLVVLIGTTLALGSLRDALINAPNGAEVELGDPGTTATVPKQK